MIEVKLTVFVGTLRGKGRLAAMVFDRPATRVGQIFRRRIEGMRR